MVIAEVASVDGEEVMAFVDSYLALEATFVERPVHLDQMDVSKMAFEMAELLEMNLGGVAVKAGDRPNSDTPSTVSCQNCCPCLMMLESLMSKGMEDWRKEIDRTQVSIERDSNGKAVKAGQRRKT
jgi:hypothetical protein